MAQKLGVMIAAIVIAIIIMLAASHVISAFIHRHPSLKMLALSFLLMVGVTLIGEGLEFHIPKGYIYFGMGFSGFVETLNIIVFSEVISVNSGGPVQTVPMCADIFSGQYWIISNGRQDTASGSGLYMLTIIPGSG